MEQKHREEKKRFYLNLDGITFNEEEDEIIPVQNEEMLIRMKIIDYPLMRMIRESIKKENDAFKLY